MSPAPTHTQPGAPTRALLDLTRRECLDLLAAQHVGHLAVGGGDRAPIIRPVNYVFDSRSQSVVFQTAEGSKLHALLHETHAAFEVDAIDSDARTGWSVIIVGVTEALIRPDEIRRMEALDLDSWTPGEKRHWLRIRAWTVSGRRLAVTTGPAAAPGDASQEA